MRALVKLACMIGCLTGSQAIWADTISFLPYPDIMASRLSVTYNASTGAFQATGFAESLIPSNTEFHFVDGGPTSFTLNATVTNAGVVTSGSLNVTGCVIAYTGQPGCGSGSSLLQSGMVSSLVFDDIANTEFVFGFTSMSGDLQSIFGNVVYVKINLFEGVAGNFAASFSSSDNNNVADIGVAAPSAIPEPGTWGLMISGLAIFAVARRKTLAPRAVAANTRHPDRE